MNLLTSNQKFNQKLSSDHINYFDFKKIKNFLIDASVKNQIDCYKILNSKPGGSVSEDMQSEEFDKTKPQMSLYVEYIKLN